MGLVLSEIHVVGAAIVADDTCLVAQRGKAMSEPLRWEFPGGKVEPGEDARQALVREIREELECVVRPGDLLGRTTFDTGRQLIRLEVFAAELEEGRPRAREHLMIRWLPATELATLDWAPADRPLVKAVSQYLNARKADAERPTSPSPKASDHPE